MKKALLLACASLSLSLFVACTGTLGDAPGADSGTFGPGPIGTGGATINGGSGGSGVAQMTGAGGANTSGSGGTSGGGSGGATMDCANALPATVQAMLSNTCIACHGKTPLQGVPTSLTGYADLVARSASDPTMTNAELALQRLQDNANPMPPAPLSRASAADIAALKTWVTAGMPMGNCGRTVDGGVADA